jgi:uncharacterized protein
MAAAIITGASTGIGREFAFLCAHEGYDLVLVARSKFQLEIVASEIRETTGRSVVVIAKDLSDPKVPLEIYNEVACTELPVEVLINNAGFGLLGHFWELDEAEQMRIIQLNIGALTHLCRLFLPAFIERRRGRILNVASTAAFQPGPLMSVYYASKAYVVSFSEALHNEARDYGVTVTALCPGPTRTEFDKRAGASSTNLFKRRKVMDALEVARIGMDAMKAGRPLAIAGRMNAAIAFLTRFAPITVTAGIARRFQEVSK